MFNKYGNVLTFILVIIIVLIVGILGYIGYDTYAKGQVEKQAQLAVEEFDKEVENAKKKVVTSTKNEIANTTNEVIEPTNTVDPSYLLTQLQGENTTSGDTTTEEQTAQPEKQYLGDYEILGTIYIPKTKAKYPVLSKVTKTSLEKSVAVLYPPNTTKLNEPGNIVIAGHNYRNGKFFSNNKKLAVGDTIELKDTTGTTVVYEIYNMYETSPSDADYMKRDTEGRREISLSTCTDDTTGRLVIWAKER